MKLFKFFSAGEIFVENPQEGNSSAFNRRPVRITSHALIDVRKYKYLPLACFSAVLLDISLAGFKLEFTGEVQATPGKQYWLNIPLRPLGIYSPRRLLCHIECRWFDEKRFRIGGVFMDLNKTERLIVEQIIETLIDKNTATE